MNEAIGELNTTVIVATAIALISLLFFTLVFPNISFNEVNTSQCGDAICDADDDFDGMVDCKYFHEDGEKTYKGKKYDELICPWKG